MNKNIKSIGLAVLVVVVNIAIIAGMVVAAGFYYVHSLNEIVKANRESESSNAVVSNPVSVASNTQILSCPSFEIGFNASKYQLGYEKVSQEYAVGRPKLLEEAKAQVEISQKINCEKENPLVLALIEKNQQGCYGCSGIDTSAIAIGRTPVTTEDYDKIEDINLKSEKLNQSIIVTKYLRKSKINTNNQATIMYLASFKLQDTLYYLLASRNSANLPENEVLLKDTLELFNSIKTK
ncbi:MAG: hypothetical protein H7230_00275 [Candidatus Parcubacteria bacterium]|nr:hypothetical protein [Candidatus Paceibacterota bacterium]